ncbi:conserved hypothetical protein [Syntrophobacter sp. SbD1]|nr:conserved hypothetical protein [Syntrophobacter sp. SbD1]
MMSKFAKDEFEATCSQFASGDMGQNPLDEQAKRSFEQYSKTFGKYLSDKEGEKKFSNEETLRRERAKKANRIYKQVCEDLRLSAFFFNNFGDWSEYIDGRMDDAEFYGHAMTRAQQMMADQN